MRTLLIFVSQSKRGHFEMLTSNFVHSWPSGVFTEYFSSAKINTKFNQYSQFF